MTEKSTSYPSPFVSFEEAVRERLRRQRLSVAERIASLQDSLETGLMLLRPRFKRGLPIDPHYEMLLRAEAEGKWRIQPRVPPSPEG